MIRLLVEVCRVRRWAPVLGIVAFAAACDRGGESASAPGQGGGPGGMAGAAARPVAVETLPAELGTIARRFTVSGVVEPIRTFAVNSQVSGALRSVLVEEGVTVRAGQVLARLDDRELAAQVASAEANHQIAEAAFRRAEQLREQQIVTEVEYERDRANLAAAHAQLDQLRTRLEYTVITAPVSGIVTEKRVEAGDVVAPQTRLFSVADVSTMVVRVQVSELDVVELRPRDEVEIALDAFPGRRFDGRIRRVFPAADPATRLVPVEVELHGESAQAARSGFLARATFALGVRENATLVPASALVSSGAGAAVFVVEDGRAQRRTVRTGLTTEGRVEILSGIEPGQVVVVSGTNMVRDGMPIRDVSRSNAPATAGSAPDTNSAAGAGTAVPTGARSAHPQTRDTQAGGRP